MKEQYDITRLHAVCKSHASILFEQRVSSYLGVHVYLCLFASIELWKLLNEPVDYVLGKVHPKCFRDSI